MVNIFQFFSERNERERNDRRIAAKGRDRQPRSDGLVVSQADHLAEIPEDCRQTTMNQARTGCCQSFLLPSLSLSSEVVSNDPSDSKPHTTSRMSAGSAAQSSRAGSCKVLSIKELRQERHMWVSCSRLA